MRLNWFIILFFIAFSFLVFGQTQPSNALKKWELKREKVDEYRLSPNGEVLLIISDRPSLLSLAWNQNEKFKGEVEFIETKTGKPLAKFLACGGQRFGINSFNFDGTLWAVTCERGKAEMWDIKQQKLLKDFYPTKAIEIDSLGLSPDGTRLVTFETFDHLADYRAVIWNTQSGKPINELSPNFTVGDKSANTFFAFSDDSELLAVSYNADVYLWNTRDGKQIMRLIGKGFGEQTGTHKSMTLTMQFSPDGTKIVTGSHDMLFKVWDTKTGELKQTLKGHKSRDTGASFSPDGDLVATADLDDYVKLWRVSTGELLWTTKGKGWAFELRFSPDGKALFAGGLGVKPTIIDVTTGKLLWSDKNWWRTDKNLGYLVMHDKKNKQLKLFVLNY